MKSKKISRIVLTAIVLFLVYLAVGYLQNISDTSAGKIVQIISLLSSGILFLYKFLASQIPDFQKFGDALSNTLTRLLFKKAGIRSAINESPTVITDINAEQLRKIKAKLLDGVNKVCTQIQSNIQKSSIIISNQYEITQEELFFDSFKAFKLQTPGHKAQVYSYDSFECNVITGNPGNGKTYCLVNKILNKIEKVNAARQNNDYSSKIPIYISLSSWDYHSSLKDWLFESISNLYSNILTQHDIGILLSRQELFIFADGLDEVPLENQKDCFAAIIEFSRSNDIIFCCREEELRLLVVDEETDKVDNITIHELLPLSKDKVNETIKACKSNYKEIIHFLSTRQQLYEFVKFPLRLNLFLRVYDYSPNNLKQQIGSNISDDQIERLLWEQYDEQIFENKYATIGKGLLYPQEAFRTYITWLAKKMNSNSFFIEEMQPVWLDKPISSFLYYLMSRLLSCAVLSVGIGFFLAEPFDFIGNCLCASLFIVLFTMAFNKINKKVFTNAGLMVVIFSILLILITSIYQGFAVPRITSDMLGIFSKTEAFAGFLVGLFLGVIFGFRKSKQTPAADISPMQRPNEKYFFSLKSALKTGSIGGIGIGSFLGIAAYFIHSTFHNNYFDRWLEANVETFMGFLPLSLGFKIIAFGMIAGFFMGFLIFSLLGGRQKKLINQESNAIKTVVSQKEDFTLNLGIKKSLKFSLIYGFCVSTIVAIVYGSFIYFLTKDIDSLYRAAFVGIGAGIIALLWFGGFEFIQHWTLRLYLFLYGIAPFQYSKWLHIAQELAIIRRVGSSIQFYHPNLKSYYVSLQLESSDTKILDLKKSRALVFINCIMICFLLLIIAYPFVNRFLLHSYWRQQNDFQLISESPFIKKVNGTTIHIGKAGMLTINARGRVKLGTFTGSANATGTEIALLGFPISDVYDVVPAFKQGALLFWTSSIQHWRPIKTTGTLLTQSNVDSCVQTGAGEIVKFQFNDLEWHNNSGQLKVFLSLADTCSTKN